MFPEARAAARSVRLEVRSRNHRCASVHHRAPRKHVFNGPTRGAATNLRPGSCTMGPPHHGSSTTGPFRRMGRDAAAPRQGLSPAAQELAGRGRRARPRGRARGRDRLRRGQGAVERAFRRRHRSRRPTQAAHHDQGVLGLPVGLQPVGSPVSVRHHHLRTNRTVRPLAPTPLPKRVPTRSRAEHVGAQGVFLNHFLRKMVSGSSLFLNRPTLPLWSRATT